MNCVLLFCLLGKGRRSCFKPNWRTDSAGLGGALCLHVLHHADFWPLAGSLQLGFSFGSGGFATYLRFKAKFGKGLSFPAAFGNFSSGAIFYGFEFKKQNMIPGSL